MQRRLFAKLSNHKIISITWNSLDNSPPLRLRLQFSPTDGDPGVDFGLKQAGLFGDRATLQGRLDSLLGEGVVACKVFLAKAFDGVVDVLRLHSGVIWEAASLFLGCLARGSSHEEGDGLGKNLFLPTLWINKDNIWLRYNRP